MKKQKEPPPKSAAPADSVARNTSYPGALASRETELIQKRRGAVFTKEDVAPPGDPIGVGISGGGIRSATFALGVFQALAKWKLVRRIDYLSTVSGGGYFGGFLGRLFTRSFISDGKSPTGRTAADDVEAALREDAENFPANSRLPIRKPVSALRENGRYLAPKGGGDFLIAGAVMLRNWVALQVVVLVSLITVFVTIECCQLWLVQLIDQYLKGAGAGSGTDTKAFLEQLSLHLGNGGVPWSLCIASFVIVVVPCGFGYWLVAPGSGLLRSYGGALLVLGALLALSLAAPVEPSAAQRAREIVAALAIAFSFGASATTARREEGAAHLAPWSALVLAGTSRFLFAHAASEVQKWSFYACELTSMAAIVAASCALLARERLTDDGETPESAKRGLLRPARGAISQWVERGLVLVATFAVLAGVEQIGAWASSAGKLEAALQHAIAGFGGIATIMAFGKQIVLFFGGGRERPGVSLGIAAWAAALLLVAALLILAEVAARSLINDGASPSNDMPTSWWALRLTAVGLVTSIVLGRQTLFLNLSSQHSFYSQQLTRAYLGASNTGRMFGSIRLSDAVESDDAHLGDYFSGVARGAPLHFINATINETVDGRSQVQQQDRKGLGLAVGPSGFSAGVRSHALLDWKKLESSASITPLPASDFSVFQDAFFPEALSAGHWVGISGAAFSTGLGARTNLGMSLLCGLANVRLGYWWETGTKRHGKYARSLRWLRRLAWLVPVQIYFLNEFLARFPGTSWPRWYLTDGGHFENMGGYELIRRKLKRIVIVDGEQDGDYTFEGLGNLVRLARVDFGAEIRFLDEAMLDAVVAREHRRAFGSLAHLRRGNWGGVSDATEVGYGRALAKLEDDDPGKHSLAHAALATVTYADGSFGWLVYLKTTLTGHEPADLAHYHSAHPDFPHESTTDQFFDEAQWESYRKLGEHVASLVFGAGEPQRETDGSFAAADLRRFHPRDLFDRQLWPDPWPRLVQPAKTANPAAT